MSAAARRSSLTTPGYNNLVGLNRMGRVNHSIAYSSKDALRWPTSRNLCGYWQGVKPTLLIWTGEPAEA
jgi:hypothetical protein